MHISTFVYYFCQINFVSELLHLKLLLWCTSRWDNPETGYPPAFPIKLGINWKGECAFTHPVKVQATFRIFIKMTVNKTNSGLHMPNLLLIAGNGRDVGKTYFACTVIKQLAAVSEVIGVKISSHRHPVKKDDILIENERFCIVEEKQNTTKDSSLFLQAGAKRVLFIMADQQHLKEAFLEISANLKSHAIVCESGGLHEIVSPGLFFFVNSEGKEIIKKQHLNYAPIPVINNGKEFDFDFRNIQFVNKHFKLKNE